MSVTWRVLTKDCLFSFILIELFIPTISVELFQNEQFISPGTVGNLSDAQDWCKKHNSRLVEITSERLWNQTDRFVQQFITNQSHYYILNVEGKELQSWQWVTGENLTDRSMNSADEMFAELSRNDVSIAINHRQPDYPDGSCKLAYICQYELANPKCDNRTDPIFNGSCYVFHEQKNVSWFEAYRACKKNTGTLATLQIIPEKSSLFFRRVKKDRKYWIGLIKFKWSWVDSGELLTFTNWDSDMVTQYTGSSLLVHHTSRKWRPMNASLIESVFVCMKGTTTRQIKLNTPAATTTTTTTTTRTTATTTTHSPTTVPRPPPKTSRGRGRPSATTGAITTQQFASGDETTTASSERGITATLSQPSTSKPTSEGTPYDGPEMLLIIVVAGGILLLVVVAILLLVVYVRKKNKSVKPNDTKQSIQNKTSNTSALDYARVNYSEVNGSDKNGNMESKKGTTSDQGNPIYGQVVNQPDEDRTEAAQSSLVYADLEFIQKSIKDDPTYSNQELKTQPPSLQTGPMGDVYAMVQK